MSPGEKENEDPKIPTEIVLPKDNVSGALSSPQRFPSSIISKVISNKPAFSSKIISIFC